MPPSTPPSDERYAWSNPAYAFMMQGLEREMLALLARQGAFPLGGRRILEVGCGRGYWLREWVKCGADPERVAGCDLRMESVRWARGRSPGDVRLVGGDAALLPFRSDWFDIVFQSTVFTSILQGETRMAAAREMLRVVRRDGIVVWYDFLYNNPNNPNVRAVTIAEIRQLFSPYAATIRKVTLAPPLVRRLVPGAAWLARTAERVPLLRTHCLAVVRKASELRTIGRVGTV
jgi:ubiquinone/menaquinone biosynthesis C-methylase UbiE